LSWSIHPIGRVRMGSRYLAEQGNTTFSRDFGCPRIELRVGLQWEHWSRRERSGRVVKDTITVTEIDILPVLKVIRQWPLALLVKIGCKEVKVTSALNMEAVYSSETSVSTYESTRYYNSLEQNRHNFKKRIKNIVRAADGNYTNCVHYSWSPSWSYQRLPLLRMREILSPFLNQQR
jgi:hypothetical protein